jgi:hypothetical protein
MTLTILSGIIVRVLWVEQQPNLGEIPKVDKTTLKKDKGPIGAKSEVSPPSKHLSLANFR